MQFELINCTYAIKDHIISSDSCSQIRCGLDNFNIIRKCESEYHTKIHVALLIKNHTPSFNRQLYAGGASPASVVLILFTQVAFETFVICFAAYCAD